MGIPGPFPLPYAEGYAVSSDGLIFMWNGSAWINIGGGDPTAGEPIIVPGTVTQYWRGDKTWRELNKAAVGLPNVDNTSDLNKPISSATQSALNTKEGSIATGNPAHFWAGDKMWKAVPPAGEPVIPSGTITQYWRGDKTWQTLDKAAVGLNNVDNTSDANKPVSGPTQTALNGKEPTITGGTTAQFWRGDKSWVELPATDWGTITGKPATFPPTLPIPSSGVTGLDAAQFAQDTAIAGKQDTSAKGLANGYASLDASAKVPAAQLPAYVDDVLEFANLGAFPASGSVGVIYVALDTNKVYRWTGSAYIEISPSPGSTDAVPEGSTNLYFTTARSSAAAPVQSVSGRTGAVTLTKTDVGLANVDNTSDANKPISTATQTALNGKEPTIASGNAAYVWFGDKTWKAIPPAGIPEAPMDGKMYVRQNGAWVELVVGPYLEV
jgi:hypothetical protein